MLTAYYFPQRLSFKVLDNFKTGLGSYGYSGQYMQLPSPADGGIIKRQWFEVVKEVPKDVTVNFFLDTAYTDKSYNDATSLMAAIYVNNIVYIKEVKAVRLEFPELLKENTGFCIC
jgi:hypothetical protein